MDDSQTQDDILLADIDRNPRSGLTRLYATFREPFLAFCRKHEYPPDVAQDAYHDAVIAFYNIYRSGEYSGERAGIKTLLFAIGKNLVFQKLRKDSQYKALLKNFSEDVNLSGVRIQETTWEENDQRLAHAFAELPESCRTVLTLFYYHHYSIDAIMHEMGYANENVTKSHKSRCLRRLREIYHSLNV